MQARADLVDLVQHEQGVARLTLLDTRHDLAGQCAHIGAAVASNLSLVMYTAQGNAHEHAAHGARDRLTERGLAYTWRPHETEVGTLAFRSQLAHREVLKDLALDLLKPVVVLVQDASCCGDVDAIRARHAPRQFGHRLNPGAQTAVLGGAFGQAIQTRELLAHLFLDLGRHLGLAHTHL